VRDPVRVPVTEEKAAQYIKDVKDPQKGGFTHPHMVTGYDPTGENLMVSLKGREERTPTARLTPQLLVKYGKTHRGDLIGTGHYFGGYEMRGEEGKPAETALDVSVGVPFKGRNREKLPLAEAMRVAAVNDQESVYDPRPNAATPFPLNPHFQKAVPSYASNKEEWGSRWVAERGLQGRVNYGDKDDETYGVGI
jgi:hypothetical protein